MLPTLRGQRLWCRGAGQGGADDRGHDEEGVRGADAERRERRGCGGVALDDGGGCQEEGGLCQGGHGDAEEGEEGQWE